MDKTLVGMNESAEVIIQRCSVNVFLKKCEKFARKIFARVSFYEVSGLQNCTFIK